MATELDTFNVDHLFSLIPVAALNVDADTGSSILCMFVFLRSAVLGGGIKGT